MLYLSRESEAIRGTWLIDPALVIPQSVLAPLCCGATRKNIVLKSRNGPILADIRVAPSYGPRPLGQRTTMEFSSHNGPINIKIVSLHCFHYSMRLPIHKSIPTAQARGRDSERSSDLLERLDNHISASLFHWTCLHNSQQWLCEMFRCAYGADYTLYRKYQDAALIRWRSHRLWLVSCSGRMDRGRIDGRC